MFFRKKKESDWTNPNPKATSQYVFHSGKKADSKIVVKKQPLKSYENAHLKQADLQKQVEEISLSSFGRPFLHQAIYNNRLQTTGGRYHLQDHHIDFNPKMADNPDFIGIIKHELTHYHLHLTHKGYRHRDADFKMLLKQVGGTRYAPALKPGSEHGPKWHYQCEKGHDIYRRRQVDVNRYRCGQCRSRIFLIGEVRLK